MEKMDIAKLVDERYNPDEEYLGTDKEVNRAVPLISVSVMAYQHRDYIAQCLDGILSQQTEYPYEIIIGEDESTDGTREICMEYARHHPDKIRLFLRDRNTSHVYDEQGNFITRLNARFIRKAARGRYIAVCEGDDYWTDPKKLQKQVSFLEENKDYSLAVGGYIHYSEKNNKRREIVRIVKQPDREFGYTFTNEEAGRTWITKALTIVCRIEAIKPVEVKGYRFTKDVHIVYHVLKHGKGFYFTEVFGVYRTHSGGVFSSLSDQNKAVTKYRVNKEIYLLNGDEAARKMYWRGIKSMLRQPVYSINVNDIQITKISFFKEALKIVKTPREMLSVCKAVLKSITIR